AKSRATCLREKGISVPRAHLAGSPDPSTKLTAGLYCVIAAGLAAMTAPALAQDSSAASELTPLPAIKAGPTQCLSRPISGSKGLGKSVVIEVPADFVDRLRQRGFVPVACAVGLLNKSSQRREICGFSATNDPAINAGYFYDYGMTPREACRMAKEFSVGPEAGAAAAQ